MAGYHERTLRIDFPKLGEDVWVLIRNPLLMPWDPDEWDKLDVADKGRQRLTRLLVDWRIPDPADESPEPALLDKPTPKDASIWDRVPYSIIYAIQLEAEEGRNPLGQKSPANGTSSTSSALSRQS